MAAPDVADRFVELLVEDLLARPLDALVESSAIAAALRRVLGAVTASDEAMERIIDGIVASIDEGREDKRRLREALPPQVVQTLYDLAAFRYTPDRAVVGRLLASEPVKDLSKELIAESAQAFGEKMTAPIAGLVGLGRKAAATAQKRAGAIGALAAGMVGAATQRGADVLDTALDAVIARAIDVICDPKNHEQQADLRAALLDSALALRVKDVAREAEHAKPAAIASIVRKHVAAWCADPRADEDVAKLVAAVLGQDAKRPLGECLAAWGVEPAARAAMGDALSRLLGPFLRGPAFAAFRAQLA